MRLIDVDALIEAHYDYCNTHHGEADCFYTWSLRLMKDAPTIKAEPNTCEYWDSESHFCALRRPQAEPVNLKKSVPLHYCRECKWSKCHINVDKHGRSEIYWWCLNWDGGTDEEGYCYEWEENDE